MKELFVLKEPSQKPIINDLFNSNIQDPATTTTNAPTTTTPTTNTTTDNNKPKLLDDNSVGEVESIISLEIAHEVITTGREAVAKHNIETNDPVKTTNNEKSNIINTNVPTIIVTTSESKINGGGIVVDVSTFDDSPRTPNQITSFESAGEYNINNLLDDMNSVVSLTGNSMEESGGSDYASMIKKIGLDQKQEDDNNSSVLIDSN